MTNAHVLHIHVVAITSLNGKLRKMKNCTYFVVTHGSECLNGSLPYSYSFHFIFVNRLQIIIILVTFHDCICHMHALHSKQIYASWISFQ